MRQRNKVFRRFNCEYLIAPANMQHREIKESKILSFVRGKTVLDCGCGRGRWGYLLNKRRFVVVGFDITRKYLLEAKKLRRYLMLIKADASKPLPFNDNSFDTVLAVEVIEHLTKEKGYLFIEEIKRVAKKLVVLTTPEGFFKLNGDGNEAETHKSGWAMQEFEENGFKCIRIRKRIYYNWMLCLWFKNNDGEFQTSSVT